MEETPHPPGKPSLELIAALEKIERDYQIAKRRGDRKSARDAISRAEELAPGSPLVMEFRGDALADAGSIDEAIKLYKQALEVGPENKSLETKHAELVLKKAMAGDPFQVRDYDAAATPKQAVKLSLFVPGLGQYVSGRENQGLIMFGGWIGSILISMLIPSGLGDLLRAIGGRGGSYSPFVILPIISAFCCHMWSIIEASTRAKQVEKPKTIARPVPPVDKDFEL